MTSTPSSSEAQVSGSRALGPGFRRLLPPAVAILAVAGVAAIVLALAAGGSGKRSATISVPVRDPAQAQAVHQRVIAALHHLADKNVRYGGIPSFLPKATIPVNRVVSATATHPALAIQGDAVALRLARGHALATAVGPDIPDRIQGTSAPSTPAAFDLTFTGARGSVPLKSSAFTVTDELGVVHHPQVSVLGGGVVPTSVPVGRSFTLVLRTQLPIGNGRLRYAPAGPHPLVAWDFDVETD
jgi:hypothetical protein